MIFWFRRDLRLADNPALLATIDAAHRDGTEVTAVFVLDPRLVARAGPNRLAFLYRSLRALRDAGVPLVVRPGDPVDVISQIAAETGAAEVFCARDFGPYGGRRDVAVADALHGMGSALVHIGSPYAVDPGTVVTQAGRPFQVFTPFHRSWVPLAGGLQPHPTVDAATAPWRATGDLGAIPDDPPDVAAQLIEAGEAAARARWERFRDTHLATYDATRNSPGLDVTSRLSADLKYGLLHPRQLLPACAGAEPHTGPTIFRSELAWREFYAEVLWRRPDTVWANYATGMELRTDDGRLADERFTAWCEGRTGYPIVDAGMRQLLAEGWMHNRVRMIVASFLVKDLHLPWQRGAAWFMRHLVDGDIASNQHGWQWTAGTGTDAAPYFRIFNPTTQGRNYDTDAAYIRRWIPELADHRGDVHEPQGAGGYPRPIVDHGRERAESLARLAAAKANAS